MAPYDCNHLWYTMSCEILHPMVWAIQWTRWHSYLKQFVPALQIIFQEKLPKLVALQIFQSSYLSCGESLSKAFKANSEVANRIFVFLLFTINWIIGFNQLRG